MSTPALMILGTASHVGKSILTAGLGRILSDLGYRVAPFKAQNMSLNSAATPDGLEIGRAQALQAEACRVRPRVEMNPVLIKPASDTSSQVVVLGRVWGQVTASDYHRNRVDQLFPLVVDSYQRLAKDFDVMLLEGAGSPAEINLKSGDLVNMRMAEAADAACLLVGDIDRGGVFASLLGTLELLEPGERERIRGFLVNKFRGDQSLLRPGIQFIQDRLQRPCLGVVHYLNDLQLEEEDGVAVENRLTVGRAWGEGLSSSKGLGRRLAIGVVALPHMANFTDFDHLSLEPSNALAYLESPGQLAGADLVILPGSKQTLDDLAWLRRTGFAEAILDYHQRRLGAGIVGICGGLQMLGNEIEDPTGAENQGRPCRRAGLGLLPITTRLGTEKVTRRASGQLMSDRLFGQAIASRSFQGYEIHLGSTLYERDAQVWAKLRREGDWKTVPDGALNAHGNVWGTYVHGLFDQDEFRHAFLDTLRKALGLAPGDPMFPLQAAREARVDRLAAHLRESLEIERLLSWLGLGQGNRLLDSR